MVDTQSESSVEFWHKNLRNIPQFTNAFIEKFASENLPIKVTLTRGYKFFHESYIHDVEGMFSTIIKRSWIRHVILVYQAMFLMF